MPVSPDPTASKKKLPICSFDDEMPIINGREEKADEDPVHLDSGIDLSLRLKIRERKYYRF